MRVLEIKTQVRYCHAGMVVMLAYMLREDGAAPGSSGDGRVIRCMSKCGRAIMAIDDLLILWSNQ